LDPDENHFSGPPARAGGLKIFPLYWTELTVSGRVTWVSSEWVNLYSRQMTILNKKCKTGNVRIT